MNKNYEVEVLEVRESAMTRVKQVVKDLRKGIVKPYFFGKIQDCSCDLDKIALVDTLEYLWIFINRSEEIENFLVNPIKDQFKQIDEYYTYNDANSLSDDFEYTMYKRYIDGKPQDGVYLRMSIHLYGDARANFSEDIYLYFKDIEDQEEFTDECLYGTDDSDYKCKYMSTEIDYKTWCIDIDAWNDETNVYLDEENVGFETTTFVLENIEQEIREFIANGYKIKE